MFIQRGTWDVPPVFPWLQKLGNIPADEMDRVFDDFGFGRSWLGPRWGRGWQNAGTGRDTATSLWAPTIEMYQRNNELVVRADLPGMTLNESNETYTAGLSRRYIT